MTILKLIFFYLGTVVKAIKPGVLYKMSRPLTLPQSAFLTLSGAAASGADLENVISPEFATTTLLVGGICANSMIINDLCDYWSGADSGSDTNMIVTGEIKPKETVDYLIYSYVGILFGLNMLENGIDKAIISFSIFTTILYTKYIKPVTIIKNLAVGIIVALTPVLGAIAVTQDMNVAFAGEGSSLTQLCLAIFTGVVHKEILMDVLDMDGDKSAGIVTIPIKYGKVTALNISALMLFFMGIESSQGDSFLSLALGTGSAIWANVNIIGIKKNLDTILERKSLINSIEKCNIISLLTVSSFWVVSVTDYFSQP